MMVSYDGDSPAVDPYRYLAPYATVCGDITIGAGCRIIFGDRTAAEAEPERLSSREIFGAQFAVSRKTCLLQTESRTG